MLSELEEDSLADKASKQIAELRRKLDTFSKDLGAGNIVKDIAKKARNQIVTRTRAGFGVNNTNTGSNKLQKLKLEKQTKRRRRNLKKRGELTGKTTPAKANLTRSGSLLNKINVRKITPKEYEIAVAPVDKVKATELAKGDNKFLSLTTKEFKSILSDAFQKLIKKLK